MPVQERALDNVARRQVVARAATATGDRQRVFYLYSPSVLQRLGTSELPKAVSKDSPLVGQWPYTHVPRLAYHAGDEGLAHHLAGEYARIARLSYEKGLINRFFHQAFHPSDACARVRHDRLMTYFEKHFRVDTFDTEPDVHANMSDRQKCDAHIASFQATLLRRLAKRMRKNPTDTDHVQEIQRSTVWSREFNLRTFGEYLRSSHWGKTLGSTQLKEQMDYAEQSGFFE